MHKVLQALLDTIMLAAGAVELGSAPHAPTNTSQDTSRRTATKPLSNRDLPTEQAGHSDPQSFAGEQALRPSAEKIRP